MAWRSIFDNGTRSRGRGKFLWGGISRRVLDQFDEKSLRVRTGELLVYDGLGGGRQHALGIDVCVHVWGV